VPTAARLYAAARRNWHSNLAAHLRREASVRALRTPDSNIERSSLEVARFPLNALSSDVISVRELRPKKSALP